MDQEDIFTQEITSESPVGILKMCAYPALTPEFQVVTVWVMTWTSAFFKSSMEDSNNPQLKITGLEVMERVISNMGLGSLGQLEKLLLESLMVGPYEWPGQPLQHLVGNIQMLGNG